MAADDPRRLHIEECAACRARWLDYMSFHSEDPLPAEADEAGARARLDEFIRREIAGAAAVRRVPRVVRAGVVRWALAVAAVAAVVVGLWRLPSRPAPALVRGGTSAAGADVVLEAVEAGVNGGLVVRWRAHPRATRYEVRLYRADLGEVLRRDAGSDTMLIVDRQRPGPADPAGGAVMMRVVAFRDAAELAQSPFAKLPVR